MERDTERETTEERPPREEPEPPPREYEEKSMPGKDREQR